MPRNKKYWYRGKEYTSNELCEIANFKKHDLKNFLKRGYRLEDVIDKDLRRESMSRKKREVRIGSYLDCLGNRFNFLTCIGVLRDGDRYVLNMRCDCGRHKIVDQPWKLKSTKTCGNKECVSRSIIKTIDENNKDHIIPESKVCTKCGIDKKMGEYHPTSRPRESKDGRVAQCKECRRKYKTSEEVKARRRKRDVWRSKNDPWYIVRTRIAGRISSAIKKSYSRKDNTTSELLGCSIEFFRKWLELQFEEGMSWDNYGKVDGSPKNGWSIEHIVPCESFDLTKEEEQKECFHYTNCVPLWSTTETAKKYGSDKIGNYNKADSLIEQDYSEQRYNIFLYVMALTYKNMVDYEIPWLITESKI